MNRIEALNLSIAEIYALLVVGEITLEQFESWVYNREDDAVYYSEND
jgi:hypothetical protein